MDALGLEDLCQSAGARTSVSRQAHGIAMTPRCSKDCRGRSMHRKLAYRITARSTHEPHPERSNRAPLPFRRCPRRRFLAQGAELPDRVVAAFITKAARTPRKGELR